ncbi:TIGR02391 family protein [uncultured Rheinheimera sp.]|uniref:TIGR02391 family protein n=1 Tax=uncultured Rheinheimera sp. TaxID=400532 RepID=UPI002596519D|nr:TIGR02391 family protein [uncultured Rheinheimera sp.]
MLNALKKFEKIARKAHAFSADITEITSDLHPFDERNIHPEISAISQKLFDDGHYSQATFEAYKYIDKEVHRLSSVNESGYKLMMQAFNESSPKIKLTNLSTSSEVDEQQGYKFIFSGEVMAIRNPRGHEYSFLETPDQCLDHLSLASLLKRKLDHCIV